MKGHIDKFRQYLAEARREEYIKDGIIALYHYAPVDAESIVVDPKYFADRASRSTFSKNEYRVSTLPRTFWYTDPKQRERMVAQQRHLYTTSFPEAAIYDLKADPDGYVRKHRHEVYGLRFDEEWTTMLEDLRENYEGVFYGASFDVVALFRPREASRVSPDERHSLEGE